MGNSQGQLKSSKFETALHMSIEQALRSNSTTPHPLFSQLYLEKDLKLSIPDVLPTSSDGSSAEKLKSQSPKGKADKENNEPIQHPMIIENVPPSSMMSPRLVPSLPPVAAPIPIVHAPTSLQGVMLSPRLPPSPLGPGYLPQRFLLPGQYPPHALPPLLRQVQPPPPRPVERRVSSSPGHHHSQTSPSSHQGDSEVKSRSDAEPHGYLMRPAVLGGCHDVGFCQAGGDIRLSEITMKSIDVAKGFTLVGIPFQSDQILVAAVDVRFLPDAANHQALLGFSGSCVGCGEKGFRYFTEFAHHVNLKVMSQAKKQKHLKYYIVSNKQGHWIKGPLIPWKENKKNLEEDGHSSDDMDDKEPTKDSSHPKVCSLTPPPGLFSTQSSASHPNSESAPSTRSNSPKLKVEREGKEDVVPESQGTMATDNNRDLKQPPKKRHRFHSVDEDALRKTSEPPVIPAKRMVPPPVLPLPHFLPPPLSSNAQDCTFVPPNLAEACGTKVVILDCSGAIPVFHGNIVDVFVSPLFRDSMVPLLQLPPSLVNLLNVQNNQALNFEANILLLIKYLVQLGSRIPSREEFDLTLLRARQDTKVNSSSDGQAISVVAPAQLPFLAKLSICASNGSATILLAQHSLAGGLSEALKFLATLPPANKRPEYIFIINVSRQRGTEFCVVVPGPLQARALIEASLSTWETLKENNVQIVTGKIHLLSPHFDRNSPGYDLDRLLGDFSTKLGGRVFVPFNGSPGDRIEEEDAQKMQCQPSEDTKEMSYKLHPNQVQTAMRILSQVCAIADRDHRSLDLGRFTQVGLLIIVPPSDVLYQQTLDRLCSSNLLLDLGLATTNSRESCQQFVMKLDNSKVSQTKFEHFLVSIQCMPETLFVLVQDQAHLDIFRFPQLQQYQRGGLASQIVNAPSIVNAPNVLCLQVSSLPYNLQTNKSRVAPENEIFMETNQYQDLQDPEVKTKYFGISDYKDTMSWTNQTPLLHSDETFELMAESLLTRYPELHSMMVRTYLLVRQFTVALLNAVDVEHRLKDTTDVTTRIVEDLVGAPLASQNGRGHMVLLRVTSPQLARLAYERLREVRDKLGLHYRFEVLLVGFDQRMELDEEFLRRLQTWRQASASWQPHTLEDLEGLPCLVIQCDKETSGETMPQSLKVVDLRLVNHGVFDLASLEQELGLACTYIDKKTSTQVVSIRDQTRLNEETVSDAIDSEGRNDSSKPMEVDNDAPEIPAEVNSASSEPDGEAVQQDSTKGPVVAHLRSTEHPDTGTRARDRSKKHPPLILLSKSAFSVLKLARRKPYPETAILLPCADTTWNSPLRPLLTSAKGKDKSSYFRQWTDPKAHHYDFELSADNGTSHPRRLLLCGPPQVGKTGCYLHFCRVLYRMLIKLQEVEVEDEDEDMVQFDSTTSDDDCMLEKEPKLEVLQKMTFDLKFCQGRYKHCSMVWFPGLSPQEFNMWSSSEYQEKKRPTVLQRLTKFSSHNAFHHCDDCQSYTDGSSGQTRVHNVMISDPKFGDLNWQFLIPAAQNSHFVFDQETGNLSSICLPLLGEEQSERDVKSPIFMVVKNPAQQSMVNLYHAMEGARHVHLLICKEKDAAAVQKQWQGHVVVVLPRMANNMGAGGVKYLVKQVAEYNLTAERKRQETLGGNPDLVWPFVLLMDDALVCWKELQLQEDNQCSEVLVSLRTVMRHVESIENVDRYALVGIGQWRSQWKLPKHPYSRSYVDNMVFVHLQLTSSVQYNPHRFYNEDVDFSWRVNANNLPVCRLSHFMVLVKTILAKPDPPETIIHPSSPVQIQQTADISTKDFVISPDSESQMLIQAPPHFLLERYLSEVAFDSLLTSDIDLLKHPIMVVDEYINLGPKVPEFIISSSAEPTEEVKDVQFGGLVLNSCLFQIPDADFIKQFHFINGARLLLISPDRNSLRRNVAELDLESKWNFRLRDELQTANVAEDKPVSLLRGIYGIEKDVDKQP